MSALHSKYTHTNEEKLLGAQLICLFGGEENHTVKIFNENSA